MRFGLRKRVLFPALMCLAVAASVPVLAQGQTPTSPNPSPSIGGGGTATPPGPRGRGTLGSENASSPDRKSLRERRDERSADADSKSNAADAPADSGAARSAEPDGGAGARVIGGGSGGGGAAAPAKAPTRPASGAGAAAGGAKSDASGVSVTGEGVYKPVFQRKLEWVDLPDEGETITLESEGGAMPLQEFLAAINIATGWSIISSEKCKEVNLPYFNLVDVSPKKALEILRFMEVYYDFKELDGAKILYVMTKEEYLNRSYGDTKPIEFKVEHADVSYMESALTALLSDTGRMLADTRTGRMYVWDTEDNLKQIEKTFKDLDVPLERKAFAVHFADIADIDTVVQALVSPNGNVMTDNRTGTIIVWDTPQVIERVGETIDRLDVPLQATKVDVLYANAEDLTDSLEVLLSERGIIQVDPRTNSLVITDIPARVEKILAYVGEIDRKLETRTWVVKYGDIDFIADQIETLIPSEMGDIIVNELGHQITVTGLPNRLEQIHELIQTWDIKKKQVLIEAFIVEVNSDIERELNVNWSYFGSNGNTPVFYSAGSGFQADSDAPLRVGQLPYAVPAYGGLQLDSDGRITRPVLKNIDGKTVIDHIAGNKIAATLDYLDKNDKATILSSPRVVVQDGEEATFENATKVPFVSASTIYGGYGGINNPTDPNNPGIPNNLYSPNNTNRIEFIDVGTILSVLPWVTEDNNVLLDIEAEDSTFTLRTILSNGAPSTVPEKTVRRAETQLRVASGETVVLGGLRKDRTEKNVSKTPIIGDLPIIGRLFRYPSHKAANNSLLLFLTTTIVDEFTHPETIDLSRADRTISDGLRHNNKDFWGRLKDDIGRGKTEMQVTIGQTGKIQVEERLVSLAELRDALFDIAEKSRVTIIFRHHPRADDELVADVREAILEANLKLVVDTSTVPLVPDFASAPAAAAKKR